MNRRNALRSVGAMLVVPTLVLGQTAKRHRLGWLFSSDEATTRPLFAAFIERMRAIGYAEGKNMVNDRRWADGDVSRYAPLADELIALKPDVLLAIQEPARVLKAKTSVIPIVLLSSADPVGVGLVKSLARPGTNVTGIAGLYDQLLVKQIELLVEVVPNMSRVAFLSDSSSGMREQMERTIARAAAAKALTVTILRAADERGIRRAFDDLAKRPVDGLVVHPSGTMTFYRQQIAGQAANLRLPSISGMSQYADAGGLFNYSPQFLDTFGNEIPAYVDRILKGAKPAELPVQQVTKYNLVVNLRTAHRIGLSMPASIAARADRVVD